MTPINYWSTYATVISAPHIGDDWVVEYSNVKLLPDVTTGSGDTREIVAVFRFDASAHPADDPTDQGGFENMMWMKTFTLTRDAAGWKITKLAINIPSLF